jgi:uncharacterized protein (DUF305 family)
MAYRLLHFAAVLHSLSASAALCQQSGPPPIVQPGAPGQSSRVLTPATAAAPLRQPSEADVAFMQGMIMHHSQAVAMTALLRTRSQNPEIQEIGRKISISQTDEIRYMKQWLEDRGKPVSASPAPMDGMAGMEHMQGMEHMAGMEHMQMDMPMMPGMLSPQQMDALAHATGPAFDHLFLTGMIQHHTGALTMVQELFNTAGAGQDAQLFDFATDVDNTQHAEIRIMQGMLLKEKQ